MARLTLFAVIGDLTKLKPHFAFLISFHFVCSVCVGTVTILIHKSSLFFELDPFRLILLSVAITGPLTTVFFVVMYLAMNWTEPTVLASGTLLKPYSLGAGFMTLVYLGAIDIMRYFLPSKWSISMSVRWLAFGVLAFAVYFSVMGAARYRRFKREMKKADSST